MLMKIKNYKDIFIYNQLYSSNVNNPKGDR